MPETGKMKGNEVMSDQEIKAAFESMDKEQLTAYLAEQQMVLIVDTQGINGESAPAMLYAESRWDVPQRDKREPLYLGRG